ncbi:MAG TPA: bifunctional phosphoribosyl-AMP cyclohydrolase/phosphoribosyl-ATP diphosphatase HisIE [Gammaproteobacteria bacterium]|nr:bifunctional phosphoribosyl-AMP cyclohydrolase/phosphoribosyl-ATP diphosphatase HisIE [Gammaproteobacteria bacterium]
MINFAPDDLAWDKMQGLLPAIVQDVHSGSVLMLGYMNRAALQRTLDTKWVTFFSRSKNALWLKGETSGNKLQLVSITTDCDQDTLLILANPTGPVCHTGSLSCFGEQQTDWEFLKQLEATIAARQQQRPENSYTAQLFAAGIKRMAQKVGEEGVEVAIAALAEEDSKFCEEGADLLFHLLVLLRARNLNLAAVIAALRTR